MFVSRHISASRRRLALPPFLAAPLLFASISLTLVRSAESGPRTLFGGFASGGNEHTSPESGRSSAIPHPSVVRITALERGAQALGSGTLIDCRDQYGLVITNWHVVRDATGDVLVTFPDGFQSKARILLTDRVWDLAALVIWRPRSLPVPLAELPPRPGEPLLIAGYGSGKYRATAGRCTQYVAPGENMPYEMIELAAEARQGDSGGPIFNQRGELAGVLFGAGGGTTAGSWSGRVKAFLSPIGSEFGQAKDLPMPTPNESAPAATNTATRPETEAASKIDNDSATSLASVSSSLNRSSLPIIDGGDKMVPIDELFPATRDPASMPRAQGNLLVNPPPGRSGERAAASNGLPLGLTAWTGTTLFEQSKSALAIVGILAFLMQVLRLTRRET